MRWIVGTSLKYRFLMLAVVAGLMSFGFAQLRNAPVDVLPEFSPPYVEIQTEALGLSAEEVEQLITVPMEQDLLAGVAWIDEIRSESVPGLSSVLLFFEPGTDLYRARQMVSERLSQAAVGLPHVSKPPTMIQPLSSASRFMIVGLSSKDVSLIEMSVLARWVIAPRLMGVPGVANVAIWGQRERQLQVQVDPEWLRAQEVSLQQVLETTGNALWVSSLSYLEASTPGTGGFIDTPNQRIGIWHVLPISSPEQLAQVPIEGATGLRLADVARVVEDHQPLIGDALLNNGPSLLLVIEKLPGTNTLEVTQGVEEALDALRPGLSGIELDTSLFRPASFIQTAITNLTRSLLAGAILMIAALMLLLWGWRSALIGIVSIGVSLIAALFVLYLRGATINSIVLAGLAIAIGVIIDDAIVDVHNIVRHLRQQREEGGKRATVGTVLAGSVEMRSSLLFATLIVLLTIMPIFVMEGTAGALIQPLAVSYALAVLASMAVALFVTPGLSMLLLPEAPLQRGDSPLLTGLRRGYQRALSGSLRASGLAFAAVALVIVAGLVAVPLLGQLSWLPSFRENDILIQWEGAPGTSRPEMERIVNRAGSELRAIPGVRNVGAHIGRAVFGDQVVGINSAQLWVNIDPAADYDATIAAIQQTVDGYPGLAREVSSNLQHTLSQAVPGRDDATAVRVFGEDFGVLSGLADQVRQRITEIPGVDDAQVQLPVQEPTLEIEVDLAAAQRYGIKPGDVRRAAATLLSGLQVGSLFEEQKVFEVVVWSTPETRESLSHIRELLIETPSGRHIRLQDIADVRISPAPAVIRRYGVSPYLDVTFQVSGRSYGAVEGDIRAALREVEYPLEYHTELLSGYTERQAVQQRMLLAGLIAVIGIFLLLQAASGNWRLAALTLLTWPAALAGGVLVVFIANNGRFSLGSLIGLLAILGITARNSVLLIRHYAYLQDRAGQAFGPELILRGASERFVPSLISAITTALVMAPFVFFGNIPGHEILDSMATVVLGGLVSATLLNLFVLPALYQRYGASREADLGLVPPTPGTVAVADAMGAD